MENIIKSRVRERLSALGINPFEAERRGNLKRGYINDLLIGKKNTIRAKALPAVAAALECDVGYLEGRQGIPSQGEAPASGMILSGIAEAGAWRDPSVSVVSDTPVPILPDPRFDAALIEIYLVRGDHAAGLGISDGSIVEVLTGGSAYRDGDVVLARRKDESGAAELSVRIIAGGALSARPAKGSIEPLSRSDAEIVGMVVSAVRVFGLPN